MLYSLQQQVTHNPYKAIFETFYRFSDFFQASSYTRQCASTIKSAEASILAIIFDPSLDPLQITKKLEFDRGLLLGQGKAANKTSEDEVTES